LRALERDDSITEAELPEAKLAELRSEIAACQPDQTEECIAILKAAKLKADAEAR